MGRFHQSMSWNQPTESGKTTTGQPSEHTTPSHLGSAYPFEEISDSRREFSLDENAWTRPASHRSFFLPLHYTPGYEYPLVVWIHSNGFNENQIDHVMPHISLRNYIGVGVRGTRAADSTGHCFDWHQSPSAIAASHEAVAEAIDDARNRFSVNHSRIVLAGFRHGGTMALRIAMRDPDRFAAAVSIAGRMPQGAIRNIHQLRRRRLPMLWQWAKANADYTEENLKSDCRSVMALGGQVEIRQYPGDDEMDTVVLGDLDEWIMRRIIANSSAAGSDRWATSPTTCSNN